MRNQPVMRRRAAQPRRTAFAPANAPLSDLACMSERSEAKPSAASLQASAPWRAAQGTPCRYATRCGASGCLFFGDFLWASKESHSPKAKPQQRTPTGITKKRNQAARNETHCSTCAATATATTSGALPVMPGTPIGQVTWANSASLKPRASRRWRKVAHLVLLPIRPM